MHEARPSHTVEKGMFVWEHGPVGKTPALVWIHGLGESGLCFEKIVGHPRLKTLRHLVPDLPGYGRSAWPQEPMTLEAVAGHLSSWLSERDEAPLLLVGHSMGGVVGQLLAERHPDRILALADVEGNISGDDCTLSARVADQPIEDFLSNGFEKIADWVYRSGSSDIAIRGAYASLRLCDPRAFHLHSRELVEISLGETLASRLAHLPMPTVFIASQPVGAAKRSLDLLAKARVRTVVISPSGHWPFIDKPDLFVEALCQMLGRAVPGAAP
jgi:pimeloyl-ACP methyl ester carboxylesterase